MIVERTKGPSTPLRLDPLSKARLHWVKAQYPTINPTGSLTIRRALQVYVQHLESALADPEQIDHELAALKACKSGNATPWGDAQPDFACVPLKKLSTHIAEAHRDRLGRAFDTSPFSRRAEHNRREAPL